MQCKQAFTWRKRFKLTWVKHFLLFSLFSTFPACCQSPIGHPFHHSLENKRKRICICQILSRNPTVFDGWKGQTKMKRMQRIVQRFRHKDNFFNIYNFIPRHRSVPPFPVLKISQNQLGPETTRPTETTRPRDKWPTEKTRPKHARQQ